MAGSSVKKQATSTQRYIPFSEVRNDVAILKDGTLRAVILVSSINFFLKAEDEQTAVINGYRQFLNSIDFPLQIIIQSRKFDISKYLKNLEKKEEEQTNDLLKMQISDYRQFVSELIELGNIMDKRFFVVIPYDPVSDSKRGFVKQMSAVFSGQGTVRLKQEQFAKRKHFLDQRVETVASGLKSMDLNSVRLDTQGLIELFYAFYNPDSAAKQKMVDMAKLHLEE